MQTETAAEKLLQDNLADKAHKESREIAKLQAAQIQPTQLFMAE